MSAHPLKIRANFKLNTKFNKKLKFIQKRLKLIVEKQFFKRFQDLGTAKRLIGTFLTRKKLLNARVDSLKQKNDGEKSHKEPFIFFSQLKLS